MFKKNEDEEPINKSEEVIKKSEEQKLEENFECISKIFLLKDHFLMSSPDFKIKMTDLLCNHTSFRLVKRDGNCFYTSFLVNYLKKDNFLEKKDFFSLINKKYSQITNTTVVDEFYEAFLYLKEMSANRDCSEISKYELLSAITYLKVLIHYELISNDSFYQNFLEMPLTEFINSKVNPLYIVVEDIHIQALAKILGVRINVYSVRSNNKGEVNTFGEGSVNIDVLNTPNHFEPIE